MIRPILAVLSAAVCLTLLACYWLRPDAFAAVTAWPVWAWAFPGLVLAGLSYTRRSRRAFLAVCLLWILYLLLFAEEPRSLMRLGAARHDGEAIRVVSLNCAGGSAAAAEEVLAYRPDVVLLQESPGRAQVRALARRLYGREAGVAWGVDASVIARGKVTQAELPREHGAFFTHVRVRTPAGSDFDVISLRLAPPVFRTDIWSPENWRQHTANRRTHRAQLAVVAKRISRLPRGNAVLIGGDFNAPAGDGAFRVLRPALRDAFRDAGRGWGNTVLNEFPVLRFDQVWVNQRFRVATVGARRTLNSDHRLVVCDLILDAHGQGRPGAKGADK